MEKIKQARKDLPQECNFDALTQKSVDDLVWSAITELDFVMEGQGIYRDISHRERKELITKLNKYIDKYSEKDLTI